MPGFGWLVVDWIMKKLVRRVNWGLGSLEDGFC